MTAAPLTEMLILQPTPFCNIDCSYCYLPARNDRSRMSHQVLENVFAKLLNSDLVGDCLAVVWHAGEPLTVPPDWYESAMALARAHARPGFLITHAFQSNGMLVDAKWVAFFQRTRAGISLSIDGPKWLHDRTRRTRARTRHLRPRDPRPSLAPAGRNRARDHHRPHARIPSPP